MPCINIAWLECYACGACSRHHISDVAASGPDDKANVVAWERYLADVDWLCWWRAVGGAGQLALAGLVQQAGQLGVLGAELGQLLLGCL